MNAALSSPALPRSTWIVVLAGYAAMFLPTYWWAATTLWQTDEQAHGAVILLVVAWLFWQARDDIRRAVGRPAATTGGLLFTLGLLLYVVGRSQEISVFELSAQIPLLAGLLLILQGRPGLKAAWFPLFYMVFMVPLPGPLVDAVTGPLKEWISVIAENALYMAGYPIARSGVMLSVGPYQLLVADACSGLHSMYSLSALGILFMHLRARPGVFHNAAMLASILPVAFAANVVRVMTLILITYHLGDEAGQGFLHGAAGIVLLLAALSLLFVLDAGLARLSGRRLPPPAAPCIQGEANA